MQSSELRRIARDLGKSINNEMFRLGETLSAISGAQFYYEWGFTTWADYVEGEVGIGVGTSYDLISITRWIHAEKLSKGQRERLLSLGRCKAALLSRLHRGVSVDAWPNVAAEHTVHQLRGLVFGEIGAELKRAAGFWMTERQRRAVERAIKVARQRHGDELVRGDLLAHICEEYYRQEKRHAKGKAA